MTTTSSPATHSPDPAPLRQRRTRALIVGGAAKYGRGSGGWPGRTVRPPRSRDAEDRIRAARATGLRNLPRHGAAQNQIRLEIVQIALDLLTWMPLLALAGQARLWEPRRLRLRLFSTDAQLITTGRRRYLRLARHWPWTDVITDALDRLHALPNPG